MRCKKGRLIPFLVHSSARFKLYSYLTLHLYSESAPSVVWALCHDGFAGLAQGRASPMQHLCAASHIFDFPAHHAVLEALSRDKPGKLPDRFGASLLPIIAVVPPFRHVQAFGFTAIAAMWRART